MIRAIWAWVKRWWKWILFPIGVFLALAGALSRRRLDSVPVPSFAREGEEALSKVRAASEARDLKLAELRAAHQERLTGLAEDQKKELDDLQGKSLEEVVAWFDKL